MFGFFKDNKPEILKQIYNAIKEENIRLKYLIEDLKSNLQSNKDFDISNYIFNFRVGFFINKEYKKNFIFVENVSSREMFQALYKISQDAEYNEKNDTATGTVKGYEIFLTKHKDNRGKYITIDATYKDIENLIKKVADNHNIEKSIDIPDFINNLIESQ